MDVFLHTYIFVLHFLSYTVEEITKINVLIFQQRLKIAFNVYIYKFTNKYWKEQKLENLKNRY